jgi:starch-binding outer membrane protein, SusD/RagB family
MKLSLFYRNGMGSAALRTAQNLVVRGTLVVALAASASLASCDQNFSINDPNLPVRESARLQALVIGTLANWRYTENNEFLGVMGRESYTSAGDDPRLLQQPIFDRIDATAFIASMYYTISNARNLVSFVASLPAAERAGIEGIAKTIWAHEILRLSGMWYDQGIKIDYRPDRTAPFVTRAQSLTEAARLLDEAATALAAAGPTFTVVLGGGFAGYDTPATFLRFNRALRARAAAYQGDYAACLTALSASFLREGNTPADMALGVYHTYSTAPGDVPPGSGRGSGGNPFFQNIAAPSIRWWAHKDYVSDNTNNTVDTRVTQKAAAPVNIPVPFAIFGGPGLTATRVVNLFTEPNQSAHIIRNEELLLLRAEARMLGTTPDLAGALADINRVRAAANAPALTTVGADRTAQTTRLLYERRYSFFFEGHRWVDLKRFNRLSDISAERSNDRVNLTGFPRPANEVPQ